MVRSAEAQNGGNSANRKESNASLRAIFAGNVTQVVDMPQRHTHRLLDLSTRERSSRTTLVPFTRLKVYHYCHEMFIS